MFTIRRPYFCGVCRVSSIVQACMPDRELDDEALFNSWRELPDRAVRMAVVDSLVCGERHDREQQLRGVGLNASAKQRRAGRLEFVLEYIDAHPGETGDVEFLSALASISPFHFHRVMSSYLGESVSAYVRRRTLERAALRMLLDGASVTTCSALAGYASSSAFARAFRRQFGQSPRGLAPQLLAERWTAVRAVPSGLEFRSVEPLDELALRRYGAAAQAAPSAWAALRAQLASGAADLMPVWIGIPCDTPQLTPIARQRYDACAAQATLSGGELVRKRIAGGEYAVFQFRGSLTELEAAHAAILWQWYPRSGVRMREAPAFHRLSELSNPRDVSAEIFFPIERTHARPRGAISAPRPIRSDALL